MDCNYTHFIRQDEQLPTALTQEHFKTDCWCQKFLPLRLIAIASQSFNLASCWTHCFLESSAWHFVCLSYILFLLCLSDIEVRLFQIYFQNSMQMTSVFTTWFYAHALIFNFMQAGTSVLYVMHYSHTRLKLKNICKSIYQRRHYRSYQNISLS